MSTRKPGYYWVKGYRAPIIARWDGEDWFSTGTGYTPDNDSVLSSEPLTPPPMPREPGYYWVRFVGGDQWHLGRWDNRFWLVAGYGAQCNDSAFREIDETRVAELRS